MAFKQEINVPLVVTIGAVSGFILIVLVIGVQAWYLSEEQAEAARKADESPVMSLVTLKADQQSRLTASPHWVDKNRQAATVPIDQAMQMVVELNGKIPGCETSGKAPSSGDKPSK